MSDLEALWEALAMKFGWDFPSAERQIPSEQAAVKALLLEALEEAEIGDFERLRRRIEALP